MQHRQYTSVAIVLHWAIAVALLLNLGVGVWMHDAIKQPETQAQAAAVFQLHKSLGLSILVLSVLRLLWRLLHPPPPLPARMGRAARLLARATHAGFYVLMLAIPLSGWLYVSTQWRGDAPLNVPTLWFGLFEVPHLFGLDEADVTLRNELAGLSSEVHEWLAGALLVLLVLHVAAALKHQYRDRDGLLARMVPLLASATETARVPGWGLRVGIALIGVASAAFVWAVLAAGGGSTGAAVATQLSADTDGQWQVDPQHSWIRFEGEQAGEPFQGVFARWSAQIQFSPARWKQAQIGAVVETASARTGVPMQDQTLKQQEWFDVAHHPQALFSSTDIRRRNDGWAFDGVLRIKDNPLPVSGLSLQRDAEGLHIHGEVTVDRRAADLGLESDPDGEFVSRRIRVLVNVRARAKG